MKKILSIMLCAILVMAMATVALGCTTPREEDEPDSFSVNLLNDSAWKDVNKESTNPDSATAGLAVYTFSTTAGNKFNPVAVTTLNEYDALSLNLADKDLKQAKKLTITIKSSSDVEGIIKLVSDPGMEGPYDEIKFGISATAKTYEFDLSFTGYAPIRAGLTELVMFIAPGDKDGYTGEITISKFEFNEEAPIKDNVLNTENKDLTLPYDGTSATYNAMSGWKVNAADAANYTLTTVDNKINLVVKAKAGGWQQIFKPITGNMQELKKLTVVIKGKAGTQVLIKLDENVVTAGEKWVDLDGTEQTIIWDDILPANLPVDGTKKSKLLIFGSPNAAVAEDYTIEISKMEFSK